MTTRAIRALSADASLEDRDRRDLSSRRRTRTASPRSSEHRRATRDSLQGVNEALPAAVYPRRTTCASGRTAGRRSPWHLPVPDFVPLDSFGVGSALVPSPGLLTQEPNGSALRHHRREQPQRTRRRAGQPAHHRDHPGPLSRRDQGDRGAPTPSAKRSPSSTTASSVPTPATSTTNGGSATPPRSTWWPTRSSRDGTLTETDCQRATRSGRNTSRPTARSLTDHRMPKHLGLHTIVFEGRPDVVLADKLVLMRYRHKDEASWKLVPFEFANATADWKPGNSRPSRPLPSNGPVPRTRRNSRPTAASATSRSS